MPGVGALCWCNRIFKWTVCRFCFVGNDTITVETFDLDLDSIPVPVTSYSFGVTINPWDGRPPAPTITTPSNGSTIGNPNPTITGTGEVGDLVSIMFDGVLVGHRAATYCPA